MDNLIALAEKYEKNMNKALRKVLGKYIKESFLIRMKCLIIEIFPEYVQYYDSHFDIEQVITSRSINPEFDICKLIVGCHSSNTIFLADENRTALERNADYRKRLATQVIEHIKLRKYGSLYFRNLPLMQGELFINYNVPYDMFVIAMRMNEILRDLAVKSDITFIYRTISEKALAVLLLLENNFPENCYSICRTIIELYIKLQTFKAVPELVKQYNTFVDFEIRQSCCELKYPEEFNQLFRNRTNQKTVKKSDYLHYGWVDSIPNYHRIAGLQPYSINGILSYLKESNNSRSDCFETIEVLYKMCHGYVHGGVIKAIYPLLHYFEISTMLFYTLLDSYRMLCADFAIDESIDGIDIIAKSENDFKMLQEQSLQRSTEKFEMHYRKYR